MSFSTSQKTILTPNAPAPIGPYSQAILVDETLYCSGQIPINPTTNEIVQGTIKEQTHQCINNIANVLKQAGMTFDDVIKTQEDIESFKKIYIYDRNVFLERCAIERENAQAYFNSIGFFDSDSICFDCGWQGSSQTLIDKFKKAVGKETKQYFIYFGIRTGEKSALQIRGKEY